MHISRSIFKWVVSVEIQSLRALKPLSYSLLVQSETWPDSKPDCFSSSRWRKYPKPWQKPASFWTIALSRCSETIVSRFHVYLKRNQYKTNYFYCFLKWWRWTRTFESLTKENLSLVLGNLPVACMIKLRRRFYDVVQGYVGFYECSPQRPT